MPANRPADERSNHRARWYWAILALAISGYVGTFLICHIGGAVIAPHILAQITPGMPREEVQRLLGEPDWIGPDEFVYRKFGNPGWVQIYFANDGRVRGVNDESPNVGLSFW